MIYEKIFKEYFFKRIITGPFALKEGFKGSYTARYWLKKCSPCVTGLLRTLRVRLK